MDRLDFAFLISLDRGWDGIGREGGESLGCGLEMPKGRVHRFAWIFGRGVSREGKLAKKYPGASRTPCLSIMQSHTASDLKSPRSQSQIQCPEPLAGQFPTFISYF